MSRRNKSANQKGKPNTSVSVMDEFSNQLFRLGYGSQSPIEATEYPLTRLTDNYALMNSLYRSSWVVQSVVSLMVDDMLREWYKLTGQISPEIQEKIERVERKKQVRQRISEGITLGRLYGGAAGIINIKGQESMLDQPLDYELIFPGSFDGITVFDRWQGIVPGVELVYVNGEPLPKYYSFTEPSGKTVANVHYSRVIRFTGRPLPYLEKIAELYWGESEIEPMYSDLKAHDNVSANMAALTFRANINTMEVQNLEQLFSLGAVEQQKRFWNVMQAQSVMMSNFGYQLVNKGDQMKNTQYTFTGLQEIYDSMCLNLCGATHYPMTKLFGRSPAGMNSTGESDLKNYYDYVDSQRESKLRPVLYQLLPVIFMSEVGAIPDDFDITFPPLWTPTAKEVAEIAKGKAEAIVSTYQAGLLNVDTAQKELKKLEDETGMWGSITDDEIKANAGKSYSDATALRDPLMGLGYGEDLTDANAEPSAE